MVIETHLKCIDIFMILTPFFYFILKGYRFDKNDAAGLKISFANDAHPVKKTDNHISQIYNSFSNAHSDDYDYKYD